MGWGTLEEALERIMRPHSVWPPDESEPTPSDTPDWVARTIRAFWAGDFDAAQLAASQAEGAASTDLDRALAEGAKGLAIAGALETGWSDPWTAQLTEMAAEQSDKHADFTRYLLAESALGCGRLDIATAFLEQTAFSEQGAPTGADAAWHRLWLAHPFSVVMLGARVRILAFSGRIDEAVALLPELAQLGDRHELDLLAAAVTSLVAGNADDGEATRREIARLLEGAVPVDDHVGRGVHLLAAFGAVAIGELDEAAALVLIAGQGADLARLTIVDRALGLELLAAAALAADDMDAAQAWCVQAETLAVSAIAAPTLDRVRARVALKTGDASAAVEWASRAADTARAQGRVVEAAESEMVLARARISVDQVAQATRALRDAVSAADATGHHAVRRSATETLATARRRLPPFRGAGWGALSTREKEVAELILRGEDSAAIAQQLYVSPATVRVHTSRVLAAFGVSTRTALIAAVVPTRHDTSTRTVALPPLTARRAQVVELVALGWGNARIAETLGISVKIVERHASAAMREWHAKNRTHLAAIWWTQNPGSG